MPPHLSIDAIRNAVYEIPDVGKFTFENGAYDRPADDSLRQPPLHIGLVDLFAFGDLNGDGSEDAVTFLARSSGGPEIFLSIEVLVNDNGSPSHVASYVIGDRVAIDSVKIDRQIINLYVITQGPGDAPCCPTLHVRRNLKLENGKLIELAALKGTRTDEIQERVSIGRQGDISFARRISTGC
jgi:hypothetical protein